MSRRGWLWAGSACAALIALAVIMLALRTDEAPPSGPATIEQSREVSRAPPPPPPRPVRAPAPAAGALAPAKPEGPDRAEAQARLERAEESLRNYREATKYPPTSRPLSEEPDRMQLHEPAERTRPLDKGSATLLTLGQDRSFLGADETARLWVRCATDSGASVSCDVGRASVTVVGKDGAEANPAVPLVFRDDGQGGDAAADDGTFTALLQPSAIGLGQVVGTLRVDLEVTDHRDNARPFFTLTTTGETPASFTRQVTEALVGGSLRFSVGIAVKTPGRYVVHGRVEDARGEPIAWVEFNDELPAGAQQVPLVVFGKLIRDLHPVFPLVLRDVDGFLLLEDAFPDRRLLAALEGPVHTSAIYREDQFSDAEWNGEQRQRYLTELQHDVDRAQATLDGTP